MSPAPGDGGCVPQDAFPVPPVSLGALDGSVFVKITTTNGGLEVVTAAALANTTGQPQADISAAIGQGLFQLSNFGQPVGWLPGADNNTLLFYAESYRDNYTYTNVYWLTTLTNLPLPMLDGQAPATDATNGFYQAVLGQEVDALAVTSLPLNPDDDFWMWTSVVAGLAFFDTSSFSFNAEHLAAGTSVSAQLTLELWGGNEATHQVAVTLNNQALLTNVWQGVTQNSLTFSFPSTLLVEGTNQLRLQALVDGSSSPRSQWYVNRFSVAYPCGYLASQGVLECGANSNRLVTIDGFTSPAITVLDITNPKLPGVLTGLSISAGDGTYRVSFVPSTPQSRYLAFQAGAGTPVNSLSLAEVVGWSNPTNAADYLVLTPDSLLSAATNLAIYRQQMGLRCAVARLDPIFNEFAYGFPTPRALQRFIATAYTNWAGPPRYAVLLGDGTYDYRNLLRRNDNLLPPLMVSTPYGLVCSDSVLGDVYGDGVPRVAIGRLSGHNAGELLGLAAKITQYESQPLPAQPKALLIADVPGPAGDFNADVLGVDAILAPKFADQILEASDIPDLATFQRDLTNAWNLGVDFVAYAGQGAIDRFGSAGYLTIAGATNLQNTGRWPVVVATTCVAGQFSVPGSDCLGEYLVKDAGGGAIAVVAPTGLSWDNEASQLDARLARLVRANTLPALGDIFRQAVADHVQQDQPATPVWIYNLLGDPALRYGVAADLQITSITPTAGGLLLNWSGGQPPYQVETTTPLPTAALWAPVGGPVTGTNLVVPLGSPAAFFRVRTGP